MGVLTIKIILDQVHAIRNCSSLSASGTFEEGVHLVSGDVGSGKSTLALMIAGLFPLSGGSIEKEGVTSTSALAPVPGTSHDRPYCR